MEVEYTMTEILIPEAKVCSQCHEEKPLTFLNKKRAECKSCQSAYYLRWKEGAMDTSADDTPETKVCAQCEVEKPLKEFNKRKDAVSGAQAYCKGCQATYWFHWKDTKEGMDTDDALYVMSISKLPGILKVGRSKNPRERAFQLAASQPFLVNVDHQYDKYGFLELTVHRKLLPYRVEDGTGREWFRANASLVDAIIKGAIAEYELSQHKVVQNAEE